MNNKRILGVLLSLIIIFLGLRVYTEIELHNIKNKYPPIGQFICVDGVRLHYVRQGEGSPVVMVHGRDGALQEFTLSFFGQVAEDFDAIAIDRPGYGYSEWPSDEKLSTETQARLIHNALDQLDIQQPILIGHSYGGAVVLQYLLDYPDNARGAVLLGPVAYMKDPPEGASLFAFPNLPVVGPLLANTLLMPIGKQIASAMYKQAFWPEEAPEGYVDTMTAMYLRPAQFTATAGELTVMQVFVQAISSRYDEIQVPVTIIAGTSDQIVDLAENAQALVEVLSKGELILVESAGHKVHYYHSDLVIDAINRIQQETEQ